MFSCYTNNKNRTQENEFFLKNGAAVLEQTILLFNGKTNRLRSYSSQQLNRATHNFDSSRLIHQSTRNYKLYKGSIDGEDCEISVKMFLPISKEEDLRMIANEVAVASQMSNDKNVLKLLGYCIETEMPMLVYELPVHGNLSRFVKTNGEEAPLPFETKLRIGIGIANALAYLHHGHSKTFIYRDIRSQIVFLDQDYGAKLFDFQSSLLIPEGKTHVDVDRIYGIVGYISPEACFHGGYSERSDVYGFGVLLSELLTGRNLGQLLWYIYDSAEAGLMLGNVNWRPICCKKKKKEEVK